MIGIIIATHGELSKGMLKTANLFIKDLENVVSVSLKENLGSDKFIKKLEKAIHEVDQGQGVLIMADLFGGTPANSSWEIVSKSSNVQCITGINLGMVLEVLLQRDGKKTLTELVTEAEQAGVKSIKVLKPIKQ